MRIKKTEDNIRFYNLFPSIITLLSLAVGFSAIRYAFMAKFDIALYFILISMILDGADGQFARRLNAVSNFGKQIDSLSDMAVFGISPAVIYYFWIRGQGLGNVWLFLVFYVICVALRLARFNSSTVKTDHFVGVACPIAAILMLMPILSQLSGYFFVSEIFRYHQVWNVWILICGFLMISPIPTISIKGFKVPRYLITPVLGVAGFFIILFVLYTWKLVIILGFLYCLSIPFFAIYYYYMKRKHKKINKQ